MQLSANDALARLKLGNERFVEATKEANFLKTDIDHLRVQRAQTPFAVILGCSDSRVPAELVFNVGLGDLFVIRVAGNIVAPSQIGSIEYAIQQLGVELVVVMGHSDCGAVGAAVNILKAQSAAVSANLESIVGRIAPAAQPIINQGAELPDNELIAQAVVANVRYSVAQLNTKSGVLRQAISAGKLKIIGAEYSLESGVVQFFDN